MNDINKYFSNLKLKEDIYFTELGSLISYPKEGNQVYFNIEENSFWFNHRNDCISSLVKRYSPTDLFFDIGGGNGYVSAGLIKNGIQTVLIEPGFHGCVNAKKRGVKNIICSTLEQASCRKNSLPSIGLFDVIEHIEKDNDFLHTIHEYLQKDGYLYITVPSFSALWSTEDELAGHFKRYTIPKLEKQLEKLGFKIHYSSYLFSFLPLPIFFMRTIGGLFKPRKLTSSSLVKSEHEIKKGLSQIILKKLLRFETRKIIKGQKIRFGSSCIIVAQKI